MRPHRRRHLRKVKLKKKEIIPLKERKYKCRVCGTFFVPKAAHSAYCSEECRKKDKHTLWNNWFNKNKQELMEKREIKRNVESERWTVPGSDKKEAMDIIYDKGYQRKNKYKKLFKENLLYEEDIVKYNEDLDFDSINETPAPFCVDKIELYKDIFTRLKLYPEQIEESDRHKILDEDWFDEEEIKDCSNQNRPDEFKEDRLKRSTSKNKKPFEEMNYLIDIINELDQEKKM